MNGQRSAGILGSCTFGEFSRYELQAFRSRSGGITYFVVDAESTDEAGLLAVVRQNDDAESAVSGLLIGNDSARVAAFVARYREPL